MEIVSFRNTMIKWRLAEVMGLYGIKTKDLAEQVGITAGALSNLRRSQTMPRIDGNRLTDLINGINTINNARHNPTKITPHDLIGWISDDEAA